MDTTADAYLYAGVRMMASEETIKIVGVVVQAVSIAVTAYFASRGLSAWRHQLLGRRQVEVAEEILVVTYRVQRHLSWIRNPGAFGGEGASRPRRQDEPDEWTDMRDTYFVPFARIQKADDDFAQFEKLRTVAQVIFGPISSGPFDAIIRVLNEVAIAARMLISTTGSQGAKREDRERWEAKIWEADGDDLQRRVKTAVEQIEALCRTHLR